MAGQVLAIDRPRRTPRAAGRWSRVQRTASTTDLTVPWRRDETSGLRIVRSTKLLGSGRAGYVDHE